MSKPTIEEILVPKPETRLRIYAYSIADKAHAGLLKVGLDPSSMGRYPHEFSGGQRQRIAIARAMILRPKLVVLDEPTSALDMTVQVQIVSLLRDLQAKHGLAYIFISHDLRVVRALSHKVMVMRNGDVVEAGETEALFANPQTDYTKALMLRPLGVRVEDIVRSPEFSGSVSALGAGNGAAWA